jgi:hypothetical protein
MQVAGAMLAAMDPLVAGLPWPVYTQPASVCPRSRRRVRPTERLHITQIDSLVPAYACPAANAVREAFQAVPAWTDHLEANASLKAHLDAVFGTAGLDTWASWCVCNFLSNQSCRQSPVGFLLVQTTTFSTR